MENALFEEICEIGHGGEATVYLHLRRGFPFFDKIFKTKRDFLVSYRVLHKGEKIPKEVLFERSFNEFLRHLIAKKFDDYFLRKGLYRYPHVPRLLGFDINGYYYEFVYGLEGFYPLYFDDKEKIFMPVKLLDERVASSLFYEVGIYLLQDIVEPTSNYVKNIIVEEPKVSLMPEEISNLWKRIDFGVKSIKFDYEKIRNYIKRNEEDLIKYLTKERVEMLLLSLEYLMKNRNFFNFGEKKFEKLKKLIELFLKSTLDHMGVVEENLSKIFTFKKSKRYKKLKIEFKRVKETLNLRETFRKKIFENDNFIFELLLTSDIPSIDGVIITHGDVPLGRVFYKDGTDGFKMFLIHFIIKKLEDFFISLNYYSFPHILRPLGSYENYLLFEFPFGKQILKKDFLEKRKVDDLDIVYKLFFDAGFDLTKKVSFFEDKITKDRIAFEYFVSQPENTIYDKISRMWQRAIFSQLDIEIDFNKLKNFLLDNKEKLIKNLTKGRFETMLLSLKYLTYGLNKKEFNKLKKGIQKFRISSLRHYTPKEVILVSDTILT